MKDFTDRLLAFLSQSPTPFHAVQNLVSVLKKKGYKELKEGKSWGRLEHGKYFVIRNHSSIIAFNLNAEPVSKGFRLVGAHTDSPCLKVKPNAITESCGYAQLALEPYGGVLLAPWFDRDLGLAGRVSYADQGGRVHNSIINFDRPVGFIPSLAIHLNRDANSKHSINKQKDLPAVLCRCQKDEFDNSQKPGFHQLLQKQVEEQHGITDIDNILGFEMSLYDLNPAAKVGLEQEFIASARLDNLLSCFAAVEALFVSESGQMAPTNPIVVLNDHEEVGSGSTSGADGPFLLSTLGRICGNDEILQRALSHSMLISADNAHGVHPNFSDKHEPNHQPMINAGPVIKVNHNQRYATNSETEALFRQVCVQHDLPVQTMVVRSDLGCGSTIGPITATRLGIKTIDIGVPQLGMHSIRELAGIQDQQTLVEALSGFFTFEPWPF